MCLTRRYRAALVSSVDRRGLGSALLRTVLEVCDREELPAYLEATSPRNVLLYAQHGFRRREPLRLGACPPITPMQRDPA